MAKPASSKNNRLLKEQVEPLFNATVSGGVGNIFSACLILLFLSGSPQQQYAIVLSSAIIVLSAMRIIVSNYYLKNSPPNTKIFVNTHVLLTCLVGIVWGGYMYMQIHFNDESLRSLVFLVNAGLIAASIATLSHLMLAYLAYMIPQAAAIFYVFLNMESDYNLETAAAFVLFTLVMVSTSHRFNKRYRNELELKLKNKYLIDDLNEEVLHREQAQIALEKNKRELEIKVDERTRDLVEINTSLEKVIEKKEIAEESLQYLASHDELTGLPNRNLLVDRVGQAIKTSSRENQQMAILFLDLDRFKNINDSLGHTIGDKLLQEVSTRLYKTLRDQDTISRNGGDEFVVVLERLKDSNEAINVAKKIINTLTETFDIQSHKIHLGASIGISIYPIDGDTPMVLLRNADTAMYRAKQAGGNQLQFYDKSMSNQLRDRLELESELHHALENDEFYMVYQPQISIKTGEVVGFESLLRWNNKKYGDISPIRFVPLLEETGLIYTVGEWVVTQVIDFIRMNRTNGVRFSINLSALQCNDIRFVDFVRFQVNKAGIDPTQMEFEITESLLIRDFDKTKFFLNEIHSVGCSIALDDFGTGYTSMNYLARLPVDIIKIDKSLVRNIDLNNNLRSIVKAIVTMSNGLGMNNVFEGVETISELSVIKKMGGDVIQGYLFSKPLIVEDAIKWLSDGKTVKQA